MTRHQQEPAADPLRVEELLRELTAELADQGALTTAEWKRVFARTPRHPFLPRYYRRSGPGRWETVDGADPDQHDEWLRSIYSDDAWVTQLDDDGRGDATSSGTMPSLMAVMLEALDVSDGDAVLEIGTGTGYNAALLSERLQRGRVTSIDNDPVIIELARARLSAAGYHPRLALADGSEGYQPSAPYDRVIATCGVTRVPLTWLAQTTEGGVIVAPYRGLLDGGLIRLTVTGGRTAHGCFLEQPAYFMLLRSDAHPGLPELSPDEDTGAGAGGHSRVTGLLPALFDNFPFRFFLQFALPHVGLRKTWEPETDAVELLAYDAYGSWASVTERGPGAKRILTQGGPRKLGDELETTYHLWQRLGKPDRERFGVTITPERQSVWLDTPTSGHVWEIPA